jgi:Major Facilitator Superfamily
VYYIRESEWDRKFVRSHGWLTTREPLVWSSFLIATMAKQRYITSLGPQDPPSPPLTRSPSYLQDIEIPSHKLRFLAKDFVIKDISQEFIMSTLGVPSPPASELEKPDEVPSSPASSDLKPHKKRSLWSGKSGKFWASFSLLVLTAFISALDAVIIAAALPAITTELGGTSNQAFWSGTGFLLAATITQPLWGTFSEIFGRRDNLIVSLILFLIGSILCSRSTYMGMFIGSRVVPFNCFTRV